MRGDDGALGSIGQGKPSRLLHLLDRQVAHRDVASLRRQLPDEFASHPTRAARDDRDLSREALHLGMLAQQTTYTIVRHIVYGCRRRG